MMLGVKLNVITFTFTFTNEVYYFSPLENYLVIMLKNNPYN